MHLKEYLITDVLNNNRCDLLLALVLVFAFEIVFGNESLQCPSKRLGTINVKTEIKDTVKSVAVVAT